MANLKKPKITDVTISIIAILSVPKYSFKLLGFWVGILFALLWLFNLPLLIGIAADTPNELPVVLLEGYFNLFRFGFDLTPVLLVLTSFFQAMALTLKSYLDQSKSKRASSFSVAAMSLIGAGCVACGGSIVAPLLSVFGVTAVAGLNQAISNSILILASLLAVYSVVGVGQTAAILLKAKGN